MRSGHTPPCDVLPPLRVLRTLNPNNFLAQPYVICNIAGVRHSTADGFQTHAVQLLYFAVAGFVIPSNVRLSRPGRLHLPTRGAPFLPHRVPSVPDCLHVVRLLNHTFRRAPTPSLRTASHVTAASIRSTDWATMHPAAHGPRIASSLVLRAPPPPMSCTGAVIYIQVRRLREDPHSIIAVSPPPLSTRLPWRRETPLRCRQRGPLSTPHKRISRIPTLPT